MGGSKDKNNKNRKAKPDDNAGKQVTDARFASVHSDPRFREPPRHRAKVAVDPRFNRMFTDKRFGPSHAPTDKRGKPKKKGDGGAANPLAHYYRAEEDNEKKKIEKMKSKVVESEESSSSDDDVEEEEEEEEEVELDEDDDSSTSASSSSDSELEEEEEEEVEEKIPEIDKETNRLAVMNMDWSEVKAVDLYVLLRSFLPKDGHIVSVAVYPSEFGLKRMEEEELRGPVALFGDDGDKEGSDDDEDEDEDIDDAKIRAYELSKLRYYYAVVEFDSVATADYIYKNCDGVEFERSGAKLDLRFIPDSMEFKHPPRDVANKVPADYEGVDFNTRALQLSKVDLTWDEDEPHRSKTLTRKFNADQLAELELQEFIASDSESDDDDDDVQDESLRKQKKRDAYRALVPSGDGLDENDDEEEEEKGQDMEVTFNTGLEDLSKRILEKKDRESESVWEAYLRKRREKKKGSKKKSRDSSDDDSIDDDSDQEPGEQHDDFFVDDAPTKRSKPALDRNGKKRKKNEEESQAAEASKAELELLFADDDGASNPNMKGYNLKKKKTKGKKGKEVVDEEKLPTADYNDPRFSRLFTSPQFALDPTDPQFKRSAVYARQMAQKQRGGSENKEIKPDKTEIQNEESEANASKREKLEVSSIVKSLKMKVQQLPPRGEVRQEKNSSKKKSKLAK